MQYEGFEVIVLLSVNRKDDFSDDHIDAHITLAVALLHINRLNMSFLLHTVLLCYRCMVAFHSSLSINFIHFLILPPINTNSSFSWSLLAFCPSCSSFFFFFKLLQRLVFSWMFFCQSLHKAAHLINMSV